MFNSGSSTASNKSTLNHDALKRTLDQLASFYIPKERLVAGDETLGSGGFGAVFLAKLKPAVGEPTSESALDDVAVKELRPNDVRTQPERQAFRLAREMVVWSSCKHENILEFRGYYLSEDYKTAFLISSYIRNGSAEVYLARNHVTTEERFELVCDTLNGLDYLHNRTPPVIHGDLKAMNVLINDEGRAVLCDFGLAAAMQEEHTHTGLTTSDVFKGTMRWCSPDLLESMKRTLKSDIWAWGCLALEMMTGKYPFSDVPTDPHVIVKIMGGQNPKPNPPPGDWPNGLLELLLKCWRFEPDDRPDVCTLVSNLNAIPSPEKHLQEEGLQSLESCIISPNRLPLVPSRALYESVFCRTNTTRLLPRDKSVTDSTMTVVRKEFLLHTLPSSSPKLRLKFFTDLAREMASWLSFKHENILDFIGFVVSEDFGTVSLVTPYMEKGNVTNYIRQEEVYLEDILRLVRDTLNGLQYLHTMDPPVVHGNLTPLNVLINENGRALLSDSGLRKIVNDHLTEGESQGSSRWSSPEVICGEPATLQGDIWSWACVVLQMVTGHHPYPDIEKEDEIVSLFTANEQDRRTPESLSVPTAVPEALLELLRRCWEFDPWYRPDIWICMDSFDSISETESNPDQMDREDVLQWLDYLITERYIPVLEDVIWKYISQASSDPQMAREICLVSGLSQSDMKTELRRVQTELRDDIGEMSPSVLKKNYLELKETTLKQMMGMTSRPKKATGGRPLESHIPPGPLSISSIQRILEILFLLRAPFDVTREDIGETLRELNGLMETELASQPNNQEVREVLNEFKGLLTHYPNDYHPKVVEFLLRSAHDDNLQHGECSMPPRVFAQVIGRWRALQADEDVLTLLPRTLSAETAFSEMPLHDPKAGSLLEQAIEVCRRPFITTDQKEKARSMLAMTLVRYSQCLCRGDTGQDSTKVADMLREAVEIFEELVRCKTKVVTESVLEACLCEALEDLEIILQGRGEIREIREATKVKTKLTPLQKKLSSSGRDWKT